MSLSGIPMVGYRNGADNHRRANREFIRHSDGGVSERAALLNGKSRRVYQAFRWWGIGTVACVMRQQAQSLSGIPMVGYRNE